jgi:hypothetical protein
MRYLSLLVLLAAPVAWAQSEADCQVGRVVRVVGTVELQRDVRRLTPFQGLRLCIGDRIATRPASIAELRLRDGSLLTVGKSSELVIREYRIYRNRPNEAQFELGKGAFRSITGFITKRAHRYEVRTPVATIGVRGTDFWGGFGLTGDGLDVIMLEGKGVYVDTPAGRVELDKAGLGTTVTAGAASVPAPWADAKLARAVATISP